MIKPTFFILLLLCATIFAEERSYFEERMYLNDDCTGEYSSTYYPLGCVIQGSGSSTFSVCNDTIINRNHYTNNVCSTSVEFTSTIDVGVCKNKSKHFCNSQVVVPKEYIKLGFYFSPTCDAEPSSFTYHDQNKCYNSSSDGYTKTICSNGKLFTKQYFDNNCTNENSTQIPPIELGCYPFFFGIYYNYECSDASNVYLSISTLLLAIVAYFMI